MNSKKAILIAVLLSLGAIGAALAQSPLPSTEEKAIFAGGCFWCMQPPFDHVPGVKSTLVGYTGGAEANPTYAQVSAGETGHREAIEVTFDPSKVTYTQLLIVFWQNINPIQRDGQFHDFGDQYTSAIFYSSEAQRQAADSVEGRARALRQIPEADRDRDSSCRTVLARGRVSPKILPQEPDGLWNVSLHLRSRLLQTALLGSGSLTGPGERKIARPAS